MSQAFVRESDEQWLHDVSPTLQALVVYLTRENNGVRVYEQKAWTDPSTKRYVHQMSNGMNYCKNGEGKWEIVW
jgi:hypothetical protein